MGMRIEAATGERKKITKSAYQMDTCIPPFLGLGVFVCFRVNKWPEDYYWRISGPNISQDTDQLI